MDNDDQLRTAAMPTAARRQIVVASERAIRNCITLCALLFCTAALLLRPEPPRYAEKAKQLKQQTTEVQVTQALPAVRIK